METTRLSIDPADDEDVSRDAPALGAPPIEYLFGAPEPEPEPTTVPDPPQNEIRYERGSTVYALDGPVGTLRQVVIDEDVAEVKALVVRMAAKSESVLMPPDLVEKSVGTALLLNVTKEQFAVGASRSPRFEVRMFTGADAKTVAKVIPLAFRGSKQRSVVGLAPDCLVTSDVLDQAVLPRALPGRGPRWNFFQRKNAG
jgi:hypothetical protein